MAAVERQDGPPPAKRVRLEVAPFLTATIKKLLMVKDAGDLSERAVDAEIRCNDGVSRHIHIKVQGLMSHYPKLVSILRGGKTIALFDRSFPPISTPEEFWAAKYTFDRGIEIAVQSDKGKMGEPKIFSNPNGTFLTPL
jgi:hypothetical protein